MVNNQEEKIVFESDTAPIVSEILRKYNLEETSDEVLEKLEKEELLRGEIILNMVEEVVLGKTQKETINSLLQKNLNVSKQTAEKLAEDVENKLLSIARKATPEEIAEIKREEQKPAVPEEKIPYEPIPINEPISEELPMLKKSLPPIIEEIPTEEKIKSKEKELKEEEIIKPLKETPKPSQKSSDVYREPIE